MAKKRLSLYDKYSNKDYSIPPFLMAPAKSKMDIAKEKSDRTKEVVGFDENYDASENTKGITEVLGIQDKYPSAEESGIGAFYEDKIIRDMKNPPPELTGLAAGPDIILKPRPTKEDKEAAKERIEGGVEEEEEIKTGKDYDELGFFQKLLKAATENPEATLALGRALLKGEGLGIGLADFAEEKISQDAAEAALEKEAEATQYERAMEKAKFDLDVAKANALADYYGTTSKAALLKADKLPKEVEAAQAYALQMAGPNNPELFQQYFKEAFKMLAERSSSTQLPMFSMPGQEDEDTTGGAGDIDVTARSQNELQS